MSRLGGYAGPKCARRTHRRRLPSMAILVAVLACFLGPVVTIPVRPLENDGRKQREQAAFEAYLANHPYQIERSQVETSARNEDPQARFMQEYLLMIDPVEKRVPVRRLFEANRRAVEQRALSKDQAPSPAWTERGPNNVGGRTRAIMFDPNDPTHRKVWAGGVAGGLWVTNDVTDPDSPWQNVNDFWANIAISSITHDPSNPAIFYVATGEGWFNFGSLRGAGIFKSTDGGTSWAQLSSTGAGSFEQVQDIVVTNSGVVLAATSGGKGVQRSTDGGQTWVGTLAASTGGGRGADLEIGPNGTIYASIGVFAPGQLWRSSDEGVTWTLLNTGTNGFPNSGIERIEVAVAPSDASRLYAVTSTTANKIGGMYRSSDAGDTWESMPLPDDCDSSVPASDFGRGQAWYDLILAVNPGNKDDLIAGAINLFRTTTAGDEATWNQIGIWYSSASCAQIPQLHADHHAVVFRPGSQKEVVFGHDGGISYTPDVTQAPVTFVDRNKNYNVTQFYSVAQGALAGSNLMVGGTQDNGSPKLNQAGNSGELQDVTGGDGGYSHISKNGSQVAIASNQWLQWHRSTDGGVTYSYLGSLSSGGSFINPSDLDDDTHHLFFHYDNQNIGRLNNLNSNPVTFDQLGPVNGFGAPVTHIRNSEYASPGTATVFLGTRNGSIFRVENAEMGGTPVWTEINTTPLPTAAVSSIDLAGSEDRMLVTFSNYGVSSVWLTEDGGATWSDLDTGRGLPDMPIWWGIVNPANPDQIFLATEAGLWTMSGASGGAQWTASPGIPTTRVVMLEYRHADGRLLVATHGRGLWTATLSTEIDPQIAISALLEGAYEGGGSMATTTAFAQAVPTEQPFGGAEFVATPLYYTGTESVSELPEDVVDWMLVSLRTGTEPSSEVPGSEQPVLLTKDGTIVGLDENLVTFEGVGPGSYYLVLGHRNHLSVMSSQPIDLSSGYGSWDFSVGASQAYSGGEPPMADFGDGRFGLFASDASADGQVTAVDFNLFLTQTKSVTQGYTEADFNFDGQVTAIDFNLFIRNTKRAASSQVPN